MSSSSCHDDDDDDDDHHYLFSSCNCTTNFKLCHGNSCSVCEHGHALYKGVLQRGRGVSIKKCPPGYNAKEKPIGGNEYVRCKDLKEMISIDLIVTHIF